jgi:hypothetical protein
MKRQTSSVRNLLLVTLALAATTVISSGTVLDLSSSGSGSVNGALFSTTSVQPTGTGVFHPFLTIQNSTTEQGYNSSTEPFDTKRAPQWNNEIQVSDLKVTMVGNVAYYGFVVDINEPNSSSKSAISLTALKIWVSPTLQNSTSTDALGRFNGSLGGLVYDLGDNTVRYDDQQAGSGSGDINILVPVSLFKNASPTDYVYLYQAWNGTQGGFEETAVSGSSTPVPEAPAALPVVVLIATIVLSQFIKVRKTARVQL